MLADVEAARGLIEDEDPQVAAELAGDDHLLLVATRQRADRDHPGRRPDVICRDPILGPRVDRGVVPEDPAGERRSVEAGQDQVVLDRKAQHETEAMPVSGHEGEPGGLELAA